jgi:tRNA (cmo5U34)-methyltransferase
MEVPVPDMEPLVDFDTRPPMPVSEYEETVRRVNVGYDLVFTLTSCFLRTLDRPDLNLLVVGVGGGAEIARFLPDNPGWRLTGVDPSQEMLALAETKAERLGVRERVTLVRGTVEDLPRQAHFDAATCVFVLHFLPDEGKLALLRGIATRVRREAPVFVVSGAHMDDDGLRDELLGAWQQYGELRGMPAEQMAATLESLLTRKPEATTAEGYQHLLQEAGFARVAQYFTVLGGAIGGWVAR